MENRKRTFSLQLHFVCSCSLQSIHFLPPAAISILSARSPATPPALPSSHEHESPDWDRSPSIVIETKDEIFEPTQVKAKSETSLTPEVKFEDTKKEEDSPSNPAFLCPPVSSLPDSSTPPAKAPPVPHAATRFLPQPVRTHYTSSNSKNRFLAADHRCHQTQARSTATIHYILHQQ